MVQVPAFDPIDYLVKRRFPDLSLSEIHLARLFVGAADDAGKAADANRAGAFRFPISMDHSSYLKSSEVASQSLQRRADATKLFEELLCKTRNEIDGLVREERDKETAAIAARLAREEAARFFHQPNANADFRHWCKRAKWTLDESIALSLGKNPKLVNWKTVSPSTHVSAFAKEFEDRRDIANCAVWAQQLFDPVYPSIFLTWAKKKFDPLPAELLQAALDDGISLVGWKDLYEGLVKTSKQNLADQAAKNQKHVDGMVQIYKSKLEANYAELVTAQREVQSFRLKAEADAALDKSRPLLTRERDSLQLMALFGAIRGYGYNPDASRNTATTAISQDFSDQGLSLSDDRVRDHLNAGKEHLPGGWRTRLKAKPYTGKP